MSSAFGRLVPPAYAARMISLSRPLYMRSMRNDVRRPRYSSREAIHSSRVAAKNFAARDIPRALSAHGKPPASASAPTIENRQEEHNQIRTSGDASAQLFSVKQHARKSEEEDDDDGHLHDHDVLVSEDGSHKIYRRGRSVVIDCSPGRIVRHGSNDGVIILSVGGTSFKTLLSTAAICPVLTALVAGAKMRSNEEMRDLDGKAVFIDRDPEMFKIILSYLRNKVEGISLGYGSGSKNILVSEKFVSLPKEATKLRDLYAEASYFGIRDLQDQSCSSSAILLVARALGGSTTNPFDTMSRALVATKTALFASGGILTAHVGLGGGELPEFITEFIKNLQNIFQ